MRKLSLRAMALALTFLLTFGPAASASWAMGSKTHVGTTHLAEGVDYTRQYLWSATYSDLRTERYIEYTPNALVQPTAAYGDYVLTKSTLSSMAAALESTGKRVIGGINGDYFVVATGAPLGLVITDGILRSSSASLHALGFDPQGNAFIGKPDLSISAIVGDRSLPITGGLNKVRSETGGMVLYTDDFSATTQHTAAGIDVILTPAVTVPTIGTQVTCTVERVLQSAGSIPIPEGKWVLSVNSKSSTTQIQLLSSLNPGDTVDIAITASDPRWETAVTAVGGLYKMVTAGQVEEGLDSGQAPRTAVGIRADGTTVFYTVDGRQSGYSVGASMGQVAKRLIELGCVEAICMDGGGSTTLGATLPGQTGFSVLSSPSDGNERVISNALFLVADQAVPGEAQQLSLSPGDAILFPGSKLRLSATATDSLGQTVTQYTFRQVAYSIPSEGGKISNGTLSVGTQAGSYTLQATADGLSGSSQITVIPTPDLISLRNALTGSTVSSLTAAPGQTVRLLVDAVYRNLPMDCQNADFTWGISDNIGTIDRFGNYTAGNRAGTGTITVSAGERVLSIPVTVTGSIRSLQDFEGDFLDMGGSLSAQIQPESRSSHIRFGKQSGKLTYRIDNSQYAAVSIHLEAAEQERYLSLWVLGDGSGNTLTAPFIPTSGTPSELHLVTLDFTGWKQVTTLLSAGGGQILSLKINPTGNTSSGTVWLDQITLSDQISTDHTAPELSLSLSGSVLTVTLSDNMDASLSKDLITVTYDGTQLEFETDGSVLSAQLPEPDGLAHRVSVTAADHSGNLSRSSVDITPTLPRDVPFADVAGHWASDSIVYLYDQGIIHGVTSEEGLLYLPNDPITRGEFAVMVSRWLALDLDEYENTPLPFADADSIPSWMLNSIKAMYALGYMQGSTGSNGLYARADAEITRAEAITLLSRIQPKGYAQAELTFDDTDSIPSWAQEAVSVMVAQGAVGGSNNRFYPANTITRAEMAKILCHLR